MQIAGYTPPFIILHLLQRLKVKVLLYFDF
jgi:hypothetical protein